MAFRTTYLFERKGRNQNARFKTIIAIVIFVAKQALDLKNFVNNKYTKTKNYF